MSKSSAYPLTVSPPEEHYHNNDFAHPQRIQVDDDAEFASILFNAKQHDRSTHKETLELRMRNSVAREAAFEGEMKEVNQVVQNHRGISDGSKRAILDIETAKKIVLEGRSSEEELDEKALARALLRLKAVKESL